MQAETYFSCRLRLGHCGQRLSVMVLLGRRLVKQLVWLDCVLMDCDWQNGFLSPVLKHGPRSLTYMRVQGSQSQVRNESNKWLHIFAQSAGHNPTGEWSECEHTC